MEVSMKVTRFYATSDGESRFQEVEIPIDQKRPDTFGNTLLQSNGSVSPSFRFVELPQGMVQGRHGQAFIADDLTGKGHTTRVVDGPAHVMFVELPKGFDFGKWSA